MAVNQAAMRRRARIIRAVNVPMRAALSLPFNLTDGRPAARLPAGRRGDFDRLGVRHQLGPVPVHLGGT